MAQHVLELLRGALVHYGYWAVAVALLLENAGIPVPGETILLLASFLAYSERGLHLSWIIFVGTLAATFGDNLGFAIGFHGGRPLLSRYQHIFHIRETTLARAERRFERYGPATIFFARFIVGMRIIAGPMAGVLRMPWRRFSLFNLLGAALWVTVISCLGYFFGSEWQWLVHFLKRFNLILAAIFILIAMALWLRSRRRMQSSRPQP